MVETQKVFDQRAQNSEGKTALPKINRRTALIGIIGGLATGGVFAGVASWHIVSDPTLAEIAPSDFEAAKSTLGSDFVAAITQQKSCPTPLASVTVWTNANSPAGIQIQSGDYMSPPIQPSTIPKRIALPFPAPYPTGTGIINVIGMVEGLMVALSPVWRIGSLAGKVDQRVVWTPHTRC
jgi:hypothetical protein